MLRTFGDLDHTNNDNKHNDAMIHIYKIFMRTSKVFFRNIEFTHWVIFATAFTHVKWALSMAIAKWLFGTFCLNVLSRAPNRQFFPQKFWVKSESNPVFLSKNLSLEPKLATNLNSRQKYAFRINIEFSRKCIYLQLKPFQWHEHCIIRV